MLLIRSFKESSNKLSYFYTTLTLSCYLVTVPLTPTARFLNPSFVLHKTVRRIKFWDLMMWCLIRLYFFAIRIVLPHNSLHVRLTRTIHFSPTHPSEKGGGGGSYQICYFQNSFRFPHQWYCVQFHVGVCSTLRRENTWITEPDGTSCTRAWGKPFPYGSACILGCHCRSKSVFWTLEFSWKPWCRIPHNSYNSVPQSCCWKKEEKERFSSPAIFNCCQIGIFILE